MNTDNYLPVSQNQISRLTAQGCRAENWNNIKVSPDFDDSSVWNCRFAGKIYIGKEVIISNVGVKISNCQICDGVRIEDVSTIECEGVSSFGVGEFVAAVNENSGRRVPLHTQMSSQNAYIMAMYRHRGRAVEVMSEMVEKEKNELKSDICRIGVGAKIVGCGALRNVNVGDYAQLFGAQLLEDGTIMSSKEAPARVYHGVRASKFIFACGSKIDGGSALRHCFVGEGTQIEDGFTAVDSLFFANCILAAGEACSIFAGPFTVSHHKSSLLIAGLFSFFNAGSGANQSNHLFKMGPIHQGINERGCKFASNAYIMLPARNGAFTTVLGRHHDHHDTTNFPFSIIMEVEGKSFLVPGISLRSCGTMRDLAKWPNRDRREGCRKSDLINYDPHNPYIAAKIVGAMRITDKLLQKPEVDTYTYGRMKIKQSMLRHGRELYRMGLYASLSQMLKFKCDPAVSPQGDDEWVDISGMYAPKSVVENLIDRIESGCLSDMQSVNNALEQIHANYSCYAYGWAISCLGSIDGVCPTEERIAEVVKIGQRDMATLEKYAKEDGERDCGIYMSIGYGIDSVEQEDIKADFFAVHNK